MEFNHLLDDFHELGLEVVGISVDAAKTQAGFAAKHGFRFPMIGDKYPAEIFTVSPAGRLLMPAVTQTVQGGKFSQADVYIWWTKTNEEFENIKKISKIPVPIKLLN